MSCLFDGIKSLALSICFPNIHYIIDNNKIDLFAEFDRRESDRFYYLTLCVHRDIISRSIAPSKLIKEAKVLV